MPATARSHQKGRSTYRPTKVDRGIVHSMVTVGFDQNAICTRLGITNKTLRNHYRRELDNAYITLVHNTRVQVIARAKTDTQALIYLSRVLGWNDRPAQPAVNLNLGLSLADMDEDAMRAELAEILIAPNRADSTSPRRRRRVTIDAT